MADSKITALTSISTSTDPAVDPLVIVDVSDTSMAATGTTKKVTLNNLLSSSPTATGALTVTGLVTAGSATITGDLTVRSGNKLILNRADNAISTQLNDAGGGAGFTVNNLNGDGIRLQLAGTTIYSSTTTANQNWAISGTTAMTLNSTGLGVGVSPSYRIHSVVTSGYAGAFKSSTGVAGGILCGNTVGDLIVGVDASGNGRLTADTSKYLGLGSNGINDRVILDASGNVGVGTALSGGSISNTAKILAGIFSTLIGNTASIATATPTTMFAAPSESTLMVTAYITGTAAPLNYNAVSIVKVSSGTAAITAISTAINLTITLSGANVQVTQTSGINQIIQFNVLRLA
jgi:hypothetical protein